MHRLAPALSAVIFVLLIACSGSKKALPPGTVLPELVGTSAATAIPPPLPTPLPPLTELPSAIWLIDVATGSRVVLEENTDHVSSFAAFDESNPSVVYEGFDGGERVAIRKDFAGNEIERAETGGPLRLLLGPSRLNSTEAGCEIDGMLHEGVPCGSLSPDGRWMAYRLNRQELPGSGETSDLWVLDIDTGARGELVTGLFQCTQCDVGQALEWSHSGRYFYIKEAGRDNRVFLIDMQTATARDVTVNTTFYPPQWSPTSDVLARPAEDGSTLIEDLEQGTSREIPQLPWPARFDPSGSLVYSLVTADALRPGPLPQTRIVDVVSGETLATLPAPIGYDPSAGQPRDLPLPDDAVQREGDSFIAVLGGPAGCDGSAIYKGTRQVTCVKGAGAASISPDGSQIALIRKTGETGRITTSSLEAESMGIFEIVVVDVASGDERQLASGAMGLFPPYMVWNAAGTHLLVRWPNTSGP
jgi:WD40-like Beta Propeller Repeat